MTCLRYTAAWILVAAIAAATAQSPTDRIGGLSVDHRITDTEISTDNDETDQTWTITSPPTVSKIVSLFPSPTDAPVPPTDAPSEGPQPPKISPSPSLNTNEVEVALPPLYRPGNLVHFKEGLLLSEGLDCRIIARVNETVPYDVIFQPLEDDADIMYEESNDLEASPASPPPLPNQTHSTLPFHQRPDFGATYWDKDVENNPGGWVYVSNSEVNKTGGGGVGRLQFDRYGNVIDYTMLLTGTMMNCGGGKTPWQTWVSCEEVLDVGQLYQVDPSGQRPPERMSMASEGGIWESFAYDDRDKDIPRFFVTEDHHKGCLRRFTPDVANWTDPWQMLHDTGTTEYLVLIPNATNNGGTFEWTNDFERAKGNAFIYYQHTEGIDVYQGELYFVCKKIKQMFALDLDNFTYWNRTTVHGLFDGKPDQMQRILGDSRDLLYFTEEGGKDAGVHARDHLGRFYTIFESPDWIDETTGLAFSPDGKFLYTAYQDTGVLYAVWRIDGLPFQATKLDVNYHR